MSDSESWLGELRRRVTAEYGQTPVVCALATVDEHGLPAARSVICRRIEATGELLFVHAGTSDALRGEIWKSLSDDTRGLFFWPASGEPAAEAARFSRGVGPETAMPATFEVLMLRPMRVDVLEVGTYPHRRRIFDRTDTGWSMRAVNP
jgi:hypothetical protein